MNVNLFIWNDRQLLLNVWQKDLFEFFHTLLKRLMVCQHDGGNCNLIHSLLLTMHSITYSPSKSKRTYYLKIHARYPYTQS